MAKGTKRSRTHVDVNLNVWSDGDVDPLGLIEGLADGIRNLEKALRDAVESARRRGDSWEGIADRLRVSRQAAWERFRQPDEREAVIASVVGSMKAPPGAPTLEEVRAEEREADAEREERKWGQSPPGLKWR